MTFPAEPGIMEARGKERWRGKGTLYGTRPASANHPFVVWDTGSNVLLEAAVEGLQTDWLILAGKPPLGPGLSDDLTAQLVGKMKHRRPQTFVSLDLGGRRARDEGSRQLSRCLTADPQPDAILINRDEYAAVESALWRCYAGTLVVHDSGGLRS